MELKTDCVHHWVVLNVRTRYSLPGNKGDLVEVSDQRCKLCNTERKNSVVIAPEFMQDYRGAKRWASSTSL